MRNRLFEVLWAFGLWRYSVLLIIRHGPERIGGWLFLRSGLGYSLEDLFRRQGDMESVQRCRVELMQLEKLFGPNGGV